jgi:hypothetical protein
MPSNSNAKPLERVAREQLAFAIEVLSNIHYLIGQNCDHPDSVKQYLDLAAPAMQVLRDVARQDIFRTPAAVPEQAPPQTEPAADDAGPLPLAAAGNEAAPEIRVDRLEAD